MSHSVQVPKVLTGAFLVCCLAVIYAMPPLHGGDQPSPQPQGPIGTIAPYEAEKDTLDDCDAKMHELLGKEDKILMQAQEIHQVPKNQKLAYDPGHHVFLVYQLAPDVAPTHS